MIFQFTQSSHHFCIGREKGKTLYWCYLALPKRLLLLTPGYGFLVQSPTTTACSACFVSTEHNRAYHENWVTLPALL